MAGVTVELRYAVPDLFVQEPQEPLDADLIEMRLAAPLTVELREIPDLGVTPHRHSHAPAPGDQGREDLGVAMQVVVRVHVCRRGADELHESRVLALDLGSNVFGTDCIQLQVEPKAEFGAPSRERDRLLARRSVHHQARARDHAAEMRLDDAAVDSSADPEVICCDDEPFHGASFCQRRAERFEP